MWGTGRQVLSLVWWVIVRPQLYGTRMSGQQFLFVSSLTLLGMDRLQELCRCRAVTAYADPAHGYRTLLCELYPPTPGSAIHCDNL